jgi:hypothetical protein
MNLNPINYYNSIIIPSDRNSTSAQYDTIVKCIYCERRPCKLFAESLPDLDSDVGSSSSDEETIGNSFSGGELLRFIRANLAQNEVTGVYQCT